MSCLDVQGIKPCLVQHLDLYQCGLCVVDVNARYVFLVFFTTRSCWFRVISPRLIETWLYHM